MNKWDENTGNGMAEGTDAAYEDHYYSDEKVEAEYAQLLDCAREIFSDNERLADALNDISDDSLNSAVIAFFRGSIDDKRSALKILCTAAASAAYYELILETLVVHDIEQAANDLLKEMDNAP